MDDNKTKEKLGLWAQIKEDLAAHYGDWTLPGFRAVAVHRFGNWRMTVEPKLLRAPLSILYRMMFRYVRNHYGIELPYSARLGRRVVIDHQSGIVIHGDCIIGDDCIIRQNVTIGIRDMTDLRAVPTLGNGVNVGAGAVIVGPIHIGDGAWIGANAVVLKDVPAGAMAVGIPAKNIAKSGEKDS